MSPGNKSLQEVVRYLNKLVYFQVYILDLSGCN